MPSSNKSLSIFDKVKLIKDFETSKISKIKFAKKMNMAESTLRGILKSKEKVFAEAERGGAINSKKRKREGRHSELEEALWLWIVEKTTRGRCHPMPSSLQKLSVWLNYTTLMTLQPGRVGSGDLNFVTMLHGKNNTAKNKVLM